MKKLFLVLLVMISFNLYAVEFQLGGAYVNMSDSDEFDGVSTIVPKAAVVFGDETDFSFFSQFEYLNYSVEKSGDRSDKALSQGDISIVGYSLTGGLLWKLESLNLKLGLGAISYRLKSDITSEVENLLASVNITDYEEDIEDKLGSQWLVGIEFPISASVNLELSYRNVELKADAEVTFKQSGVPKSGSDTADFSHSWLSFGLLYQF
ncbi:MAG: hypothetical protein MJE63_11820 [Proteobacteria bacterium]|nr:hypothetical protein [Pseudomonadota bacterium]